MIKKIIHPYQMKKLLSTLDSVYRCLNDYPIKHFKEFDPDLIKIIKLIETLKIKMTDYKMYTDTDKAYLKNCSYILKPIIMEWQTDIHAFRRKDKVTYVCIIFIICISVFGFFSSTALLFEIVKISVLSLLVIAPLWLAISIGSFVIPISSKIDRILKKLTISSNKYIKCSQGLKYGNQFDEIDLNNL